MRITVVPLRERGLPRPHRTVRAEVPLRGELIVYEQTDSKWNRTVRIASLVIGQVKAQRAVLPELINVELVAMGQFGFTLASIEHLDGVEFAQSWWCRTE